MKLGMWLDAVRRERPLVHNITNLVVTNIAANALLSVGASPVMAYAHEEVGEMASIAKALSLNMGTLTPDVVTAMRIAGRAAETKGVPIIFDPVGVGATAYRTQVATDLLRDVDVTVLRANAGEMSVLLGLAGEVKGVDALQADEALPTAMKHYALASSAVVIATGPVDLVTDGHTTWQLSNGHPLLAAITGSGCMLTALLGAFVGVVPEGSPLSTYAEACVAAITSYNVAAEQAAQKALGPGTFHMALFDCLYNLDSRAVDASAGVEVTGA
ncbi:hydroxyethylthiazole kinase [Alicyclobacillus fastidiosus]|uniref:Hydroxyethylthiazole kinase n=1 Tax=Alicyclobacillus fastidiosus TaxID=392011 RepID=A0ABY6ZK18_9BACL|nr:hydroxyethylthiazole kinase [Alicyclobacillus fastidiosus]WAH43273.1 hydroxyethylthiazole kinase [Alicyclobacillus fastidiosus]GMA65320.1 hydroxyethylthiazole kinase [Alicyclobacillus fastidiosus]